MYFSTAFSHHWHSTYVIVFVSLKKCISKHLPLWIKHIYQKSTNAPSPFPTLSFTHRENENADDAVFVGRTDLHQIQIKCRPPQQTTKWENMQFLIFTIHCCFWGHHNTPCCCCCCSTWHLTWMPAKCDCASRGDIHTGEAMFLVTVDENSATPR